MDQRPGVDANVDAPAGSYDLKILHTEKAIAERLEQLAAHIAQQATDDLLVVAILKGSFIFAADLLRALHRAGVHPDVDFLTLSSYRGSTTSSGKVDILRDLDLSVTGRTVLVIDDVLDSGRTLAFAKHLFLTRGASSVRSCVLINKQVARAADVEADFKAFDCSNEFVVGYGMDAAHQFRQLPYVAILKQDNVKDNTTP